MRITAHFALCSAGWLLGAGADPGRAEEYRVQEAFTNLVFDRPLFLTHVPDGSDRLAVAEQNGRVFLFPNRGDASAAPPALDLGAKVRREHNEEGLLGLAFHPRCASNRQVFLMYSASLPRRNVLSRFRLDEAMERIVPESEEVILEVAQPFGNHNGGMIDFGPDGFLYVSFGDGGGSADPFQNGQNRGVLLAKMLRLDVDRADPGLAYAIPPDNPFVGLAGARGEIWAWGLRNVWRFSFDRATGDLWAGDVGQWAWEEIDLIQKGGNYGWHLREGRHPFMDPRNTAGKRRKGKPVPPRPPYDGPIEEPVIDHPRREARSITGGYVYRGKNLPSLAGAYVYGDFVTGHVWMLRYDGRTVTEHRRIAEAPAPSSFGEDRDGELYVVCFDGKIYRLAAM